MRTLTFIVGTGRSGSTALSRIVHAHPDVLSLNEFLSSVQSRGFPEGRLDGGEFWRLLADPNPQFERMIRNGVPMPEFLYTRRPGRFATETTGIPALSLMVLPHLTDDPDGLFDELEGQVRGWPDRTAAGHYEALFNLLCTRFGRTAVVERSGYSLHRVPLLRKAFPQARFVHLFRDGPDCALSMKPAHRLPADLPAAGHPRPDRRRARGGPDRGPDPRAAARAVAPAGRALRFRPGTGPRAAADRLRGPVVAPHRPGCGPSQRRARTATDHPRLRGPARRTPRGTEPTGRLHRRRATPAMARHGRRAPGRQPTRRLPSTARARPRGTARILRPWCGGTGGQPKACSYGRIGVRRPLGWFAHTVRPGPTTGLTTRGRPPPRRRRRRRRHPLRPRPWR